MSDIYPIKNVLEHFFSYLKPETWYMLAGAVCLYFIYEMYMFIWCRYQNAVTQEELGLSNKESPMERLDAIGINDAEFYEKISLLLRSLMEESDQIKRATRKTPDEIYKELPSLGLKKILDTCTHHEYMKESGDSKESRNTVKESVRDIIKTW